MSKSKECPICGKPAQTEHMPFCSARCHKVDLHRWLGEVYRVSGEPGQDEQSPDDEDGDQSHEGA